MIRVQVKFDGHHQPVWVTIPLEPRQTAADRAKVAAARQSGWNVSDASVISGQRLIADG